ncbi:MAG: outer membrane beta-barrel protein [Bryobacteraceae bacterium]
MILRGCVLFWVAAGALQGQWFVGAGGGISTLSADGQTRIDDDATAISLYKPENGPTAHVFAGRDVNDYFSLQGSYTWNRNALGLTGARLAAGAESTFQQDYRSRSQAAAAEGLLYFRGRASRFRPYLSGGLGVVRLDATAGAITVSKGAIQLPPARFQAAGPMWRTAVGIDVRLPHGYAFRYSFWETLSGNPVSKQLAPPGQRNLANFQSVFCVLKRF